MFNPSRLTLARQRRGLTKTKLAAAVGLSVRTVSAYEAGEIVPSDESVGALSRELKFPIDFFHLESAEIPSADAVSFRALSSMTARQRDAVLGAGAIALMLGLWIRARFSLPEVQIPDLRGQGPESAAAAVRALWGLGERPVKNMVHLLESKGVMVFSLVEDCKDVDAYSMWSNGKPYVFLNTFKSAERGRFDAAHELAHLVLHRHGTPQGREAELEADRFASAFLMPIGSILAIAPKHVSIASLIALKVVWGVSLLALVYRLHSVGVVSEWIYRSLCIEASRLGYRRNEPNGGARETSQLLTKVFSALRESGQTKEHVSRDLVVFESELDALVFGLTLRQLSGRGGIQCDEPRVGATPTLRVVR